MERTISAEERMRRAEEIYARRENNKNNLSNIPISSSQVVNDKSKTNFSLYRKLVVKILVCILIYLIFSIIKESSYIFSENVIIKSKEILNKDINFSLVKSNIEDFFKNHKKEYMYFINLFNTEKDKKKENCEIPKEEKKEEKEKKNENIVKDEENKEEDKVENETKKEEKEEQKENLNVGIGGASSEQGVVFNDELNEKNKTQMEIDAEYIKNNFKCVLPTKGRITSPYGKREPTKIVSANHQGIDIGVIEGTKIVSAIDGEVSVVSNQGEYGTHIKIVNQDITTIYAHCSEILVKEKEKIKAGQLIALSGNTGKTTGPHLHFEVRRETRTIDPELILNWK